MLSALDAEDHRGVILCRRNRDTAVSELVSLVDLPAYPEALAAGTLGDAVSLDRLAAVPDTAARVAALEELLASL